MHPAFSVFTEETRRKVADLFDDPHEETYSREAPIDFHVGSSETTLRCCPIGACLVFDGYISAIKPDHHDKRYPMEEIAFVNAVGNRILPVAPSMARIEESITAKSPELYQQKLEELGITSAEMRSAFSSFYVKWDSGLITRSDLRGLILED